MDRILKVLGKETAWLILKELSEGNKTPTELAKKLDMSVANIDQFLAMLEDKRIVSRHKKIRAGRGRPFTEYTLNKEGPVFVFVPVLGKRMVIEADAKTVMEFVKKHKGKPL